MNSTNYFEQVADQWDRMREGFFAEGVRLAAYKVADVRPGQLAADIGAGTGFVTEGLIAQGLKVIAVDQSAAMLAEIQNKLGGTNLVECRLGDAESLPLADEEVDYIFANMFLHHVERPLEAIREMCRVLKWGGRLVITDLDEHKYTFLQSEQFDRWLGFSRSEIKKWFQQAGLQQISIDCVGQNCCSQSNCSQEQARISIFVAAGSK